MNDNLQLKTFLIKQLSFLDENKFDLVDKYYPYADASIVERKKVQSLIHHYMQQLEGFVQQDAAELPKFVFVGSRVSFVDMNDGYEDSFMICFPEDSDPDSGCISFLSPVGRQLLLAVKDVPFEMETLAGKTKVKVTKIQFR